MIICGEAEFYRLLPSEAPGGLPELHGIKHRLDVIDDAGEIFQNRSLKKRKGRGAGSALKTSVFFFFTFSTNDSYFSRGEIFLYQRVAASLGSSGSTAGRRNAEAED